MMIGYGCVMWGSGWYYPALHYYGGIYYPLPHTYGMGAWYNPYTGAYGRGYGAYGPYGGVGMGAAYNPRHRHVRARSHGLWSGMVPGLTPRRTTRATGSYAQTRQGSNVYGNWGSSTVQQVIIWALDRGMSINYRNGTSTSRLHRSSVVSPAVSRSQGGSQTTVARTAGGDVYAGRDGNVYLARPKVAAGNRATDPGGWESGQRRQWRFAVAFRRGRRSGRWRRIRPSQQPSASTRPANTSSTSVNWTGVTVPRGLPAIRGRPHAEHPAQSGGMSRSSSGSFGGGARTGRWRRPAAVIPGYPEYLRIRNPSHFHGDTDYWIRLATTNFEEP